ncbi:DJ-1/PfpI family protein [Colletotrichum karsti]|uniref:DJ-1/PfpI family protein n=1 Tax=Colletotrichum karsti TaxID=1095194 RepID=A0A9P6I868_9PEZI|nr:DJ-1/PfpI family protein [Colletotrichum karsti]KAF9877749.1 DJ-1/PfpI family protein [Colletotrichum karsti]
MKFTVLTILASAASLTSANPLHARSTTITTRAVANDTASNCTTPLNYGALIFDGLDMIDIWGPLDILQLNAHTYKMNVHLIAPTLDPITTGNVDPSDPAKNKQGSSFWPTIAPTATFADDLDLDVLIVPGGPGVRADGLEPIVDYVRDTYPKLKYLITICTGASLAARAGVLDGKRATTNKRAWAQMTAFGPNVEWVAPARYVVDGNIWSSSGVAASLDLTYAFVEKIYGKTQSTLLANTMEHTPLAPEDDVFTDIWNVPHTNV